jgi:hypothetical protein
MVTIRTFRNRYEAEAFGRVLEQEHIPFILQSADSGGQLPVVYGMPADILVSEADRERAEALLENEQ